jgi:predicted TPR repeat methyltransferase
MTLPETDDPDSEIGRLRERLLLAPGDMDAIVALAGSLEARNDFPAAIDLYQRALRVEPYDIPVMLRLAVLWSALGDAERARPWLTRALQVDPDCAEAGRLLSDLGRGQYPTAAYIRTLFDQYADRFDTELTGTLHYRAPELVAEILRASGVGEQTADILDLGCGTGLSGAALQIFSRRLDGIDLSPGMIARARARGLYSSLEVADAESYLRAAEQEWSVIAAVDMLNYVGDLTSLFVAAILRLAPGGLVVGTLEAAPAGVVLTPKRRYAHGPDHLAEAVEAAGLVLAEIRKGRLRTEGGLPVEGLVFAAKAPRR